MYQKYKNSCKKEVESCGSDNYTWKNVDDISLMSPFDMGIRINECWNAIHSVCLNDTPATKSDPESHRSGWKTVRVFVSSTFTDFNSEREVLVKQVFPTLKEWCEPLKLRIVECDLRWGVPKDSSSSTAIMTCMEELDRCNKETNGEPFFINMLGERYGWIPDKSDVHEEVRQQYDWVPNTSITHMEILVGAYRSKNRNAAFFLRDPAVLQDIPTDMLMKFQDEHPFSQLHLENLKKKLQERFPDQVFQYEAAYQGIDPSTGRNLAKLGELNSFSETVLNFLKMAISRKFPNVVQVSEAPHFLEEHLHHQIMASKAAYVLGRERELKLLSDFVKGEVESTLSQLNCPDTQDKEQFESSYKEALDMCGLVKEEDHPILAVLGESGIGKSAVLAKLASDLIQNGESVMYHCVGISHNSFRENNLLLRIVAALSPGISDKELESLNAQSVANLQAKMLECVRNQRKSQKRVTLIVDGINELANTSTVPLSWLLPLSPGKIRCVVSCNSQDSTTILHLARKKPYALQLGAFDTESRKVMVEQYLQVFRKTLDSAQLATLVSHLGSANPLWLSIACEELRVHGDFRTLTHKVESLPPDLNGLFELVLQRLLHEDETECMLKVLALICFSMDGLPESHIPGLLGDFKNKTEAPPVIWATLRRQLKPLIRMITVWHTGEPRIQFFHNTILQAVQKEVLSTGRVQTTWHSLLAAYYKDVCQDKSCTALDLPYHLENAKDKVGLLNFLRNDFRSFSTPQMLRVKHAMSLRCTKTVSAFNATEYHLCVFCDAPTKFKFGPGGGKNSEKCVICGVWTPNQVTRVKPKLCASHTKLAAPNMMLCNVCGAQIHNGPAATGRLCFQCSNWRGSQNQCSQLVTE